MAGRWSHGPIRARHAATPHVLRWPPGLPGLPGTCRPPGCAPSTGLDPRALLAWSPREPAPPLEPAAARSAHLFVARTVARPATTNRLPSRAPFFGIQPAPAPAPLLRMRFGVSP